MPERWPGIIEAYRARLPVTEETPVVAVSAAGLNVRRPLTPAVIVNEPSTGPVADSTVGATVVEVGSAPSGAFDPSL